MEKEIYRHYGSKHFNMDLFLKARNKPFSNKPHGGLWASPTKNVDVSWEDWCKGNDYNVDKLGTYFDFTLKDNANVLTIISKEDLNNLPRIEKDEEDMLFYEGDRMNTDIDFEEIAKNYDAIMVWIYRDSLSTTFSGIYYELYGWDCDSLLVLNLKLNEEVN